jgi:hypothetical protein
LINIYVDDDDSSWEDGNRSSLEDEHHGNSIFDGNRSKYDNVIHVKFFLYVRVAFEFILLVFQLYSWTSVVKTRKMMWMNPVLQKHQ